jgi:hypothetical protein
MLASAQKSSDLDRDQGFLFLKRTRKSTFWHDSVPIMLTPSQRQFFCILLCKMRVSTNSCITFFSVSKPGVFQSVVRAFTPSFIRGCKCSFGAVCLTDLAKITLREFTLPDGGSECLALPQFRRRFIEKLSSNKNWVWVFFSLAQLPLIVF